MDENEFLDRALLALAPACFEITSKFAKASETPDLAAMMAANGAQALLSRRRMIQSRGHKL